MASDLTVIRRERVRELFGKSDKRIAEILIDEGFAGAVKRTKEAKLKQFDSLRRLVGKDRDYWRAEWRKERRITIEDTRCSTEEYIARLQSRIEDLELVLDDPKTRSTARVQALAEIRQLEQAIAKAQGVETAPKTDAESESGAATVPFIGLVLDLGSTTPETRERIIDGINSKKRDDE